MASSVVVGRGPKGILSPAKKSQSAKSSNFNLRGGKGK